MSFGPICVVNVFKREPCIRNVMSRQFCINKIFLQIENTSFVPFNFQTVVFGMVFTMSSRNMEMLCAFMSMDRDPVDMLLFTLEGTYI